MENKNVFYKVRVGFSKFGVMRYVGHLDLMRYFQKAIRRAKLPIRYTEGFSPHQMMSFASPLGVGLTSEGEYMDIELTEEIPSEEGVRRLGEEMAEGITINSFSYLRAGAKKAMAAVAAAQYIVYFKEMPEELKNIPIERYQEAKERLFAKEEISVEKQSKKSVRKIDLKPLIYDFQILRLDKGSYIYIEERAFDFKRLLPDWEDFCLSEGDILFSITLSGGSAENVKPELFFSAYLREVFASEEYRLGIHRRELFMTDGEGKFVPLYMDGEKR